MIRSFVNKASTKAIYISRLSWSNTTCCIYLAYASLSDCTLIARTAGPLELLSIFTCKQVLSAEIAICPPRASISLTSIPLAGPPIEGLHGILPILLKFPHTIKVLNPNLARARAASIPACPPPTTMLS